MLPHFVFCFRLATFGHDTIHDKYTTRLKIHDTIGKKYTIDQKIYDKAKDNEG